ncbi:MAG: PTS system mannose/fructose/sorbose family transporter subunit IID [Chloroflexi bacterium]|nr:PTS system mannose/fructose/sorbose family transporter subunit IID [Chloroflexota bacterium]
MAAKNERLTKPELTKLWWRYMWWYNSSASFERFHAMGIVYSLIPLWDKYYDKAKKFAAMKRHTHFYNTEMQVGALIQGITVGLEEQKALGKDVSDDVIRANKVGLMGPIAGIGDSILVGVIIPILLSIAISLSSGGSVVGPLFYIATFVALIVLGSKFLFDRGYTLGVDAVKTLIGDKAKKVVDAIILLGVTIMGGMAASYVGFTTKISFGSGEEIRLLQDTLDGIFPKLLPLLLVLSIWALMAKKKVSPLIMTIILAVFAFVAAFFKII